MKPEIWGKYGWCFFHLVTMGYPENPTQKDKNKYYEYIQCLKYVLPCDKCNYNLRDHLKKYPLSQEALSSRKSLVVWGIELHNIVNYYTGKPMLTHTEAIIELNKIIDPPTYEHMSNIDTDYSWHCLFLVCVCILLLIYIGSMKFKQNSRNWAH